MTAEMRPVGELRIWWRTVSVPQRLLIAAAFAYGGVFMLLLAFGRPGLGIGEGFFVPVILAAAATSAPEGALAGLLALVLYELGIHHGRGGLAWGDFDDAAALTRFVSYVAAGVVVGYLAKRLRGMLAESLAVLDDLLEIAQARLEEGDYVSSAASRD